MKKPNSGKVFAIVLFVITVLTIAVMWQTAFWSVAVADVAVFCLAAVWLVFYATGRVRLHLNWLLGLLCAIALWPAFQSVAGLTIYRWATSVASLYWAACAAIAFISVQIFLDPGLRRSYLRALAVFGFVIAVIAPLQLYTSDAKIFWMFEVPYSNVAMGPFVYANQYAAFIELLLPISLAGILSERSGWRTFHLLAAVVMYASVVASASRTGFALTSLEAVVVPFLVAKRERVSWRQVAVPGALFLLMLVILGLAVGPDKLIGKLQQKNPFRGRREFSESSLRMIRDQPLFGIGVGNWSTAYPAYATFDDGLFANQAHDDWAQWAVEGGIPFALLMLAVAIWAVPRAIRTGWGLGIPIIFAQCLVDYPIQRMGVAIVFFTILAAIAWPDGEGKPSFEPRISG